MSHGPAALSPGAVRLLIGLFCLVICVPPVWREVVCSDGLGPALRRLVSGSGPITQRLREFDEVVTAAQWTGPGRRSWQSLMARVFQEGNAKVTIAPDGVLYYRPGLISMIGPGSLRPEPLSVAKDPELAARAGGRPDEIIGHFAAQLRERGVPLLLVPIADKSLRLAGAGAVPPDAAAFYQNLTSVGVEYLRLTPEFLRTDTHWTPESLAASVAQVAQRAHQLMGGSPAGGGGQADSRPLPLLTGMGDLAQRLDVPNLRWEEAVRPLLWSQARLSPEGAVVVLGDSFVNVFADPDLAFFAHQKAGFAAALSSALNTAVHTLAVNGGGATETRERFASLPDAAVRGKKLVVWALAERDLFLTRSAAHSAGVSWRRVSFRGATSVPRPAMPAGAVTLDVTLTALAPKPKPGLYPSALFCLEAKVDRVVTGTYAHDTVPLVAWNIRNQVPQPPASWAVGQRLHVTVAPFLTTHPELTSVPISTVAEEDFLRPLMFVETASAP